MTTKKKSEAMKFLEKLAGKLTLPSLLTAIRQGEEMSQVEFAELLGVSRQYLCDIEHGRRTISPKAAAAFGLIVRRPCSISHKYCLETPNNSANSTWDISSP